MTGINLAQEVSGFFYQLGRHLGRKAVPMVRKSKNLWGAFAGSEEQALEAEQALGREMAGELRRAFMPLRDPGLQSWAQGICDELAQRLKQRRLSFSCELYQEDLPASVALPGGAIFLSDSLVRFCSGDDQIAFVLAHEIAHVLRKHAVERVLSDTAFKVASAAATRFGAIGGVIGRNGLAWVRGAYSKECEREADEFGIMLAARAGFQVPPIFDMLNRAEVFLQQTDPSTESYFRVHPTPAQRRAWIAAALKEHPLTPPGSKP